MTEATRSPLAALSLVGMPVFLAVASQVMVAVALPLIGQEFGEFARLHWLVVGYIVALTISSPVYGVLGDRHGRRATLMVALCVYAAGSLICALAWNFESLVFGRLVRGLGGGGLMSLAQAIIGQLVRARETGRAQGYAASIGMAASTGGPMLAGVLTQYFGWRSMFIVVIVMALAALVILVSQKLPRHASGGGSFDITGLAWLSVAILAFTAAVEFLKQPEHWLWSVVCGLVALLATVALVRSQQGREGVLFPPQLFGITAIRRLSLLVAGHGATLVTLTTMIPMFQSITRGASPIDVAMTMLAMTLAIGLSGVLTGNLISLTGRTALWPSLALPVSFLGLCLLASLGGQLGRAELIGVYVLTGIGLGTVMPVVQTSIQFVTPGSSRGSAASAVTFFRSIGAMSGTAIASLVLLTWATGAQGVETDGAAMFSGPSALPPAALASWQAAFQATFIISLVFVVAMWLFAATLPVRKIR